LQLTLEDSDDNEVKDNNEDGRGLDYGIRKSVAGQPVLAEALGSAVLKREVNVRHFQAQGQELIVAIAIHETDLPVERFGLILKGKLHG
jgi:hypothetical protein